MYSNNSTIQYDEQYYTENKYVNRVTIFSLCIRIRYNTVRLLLGLT